MSLATGANNIINRDGEASFVSGAYNEINGRDNDVGGSYNKTFGSGDTVKGTHNIAKSNHLSVVGTYNKTAGETRKNPIEDKTQPLFVVGNGSSEENRSDAFVVTGEDVLIKTEQGIDDDSVVKLKTLKDKME
jgi:hypothetical protein